MRLLVDRHPNIPETRIPGDLAGASLSIEEAGVTTHYGAIVVWRRTQAEADDLARRIADAWNVQRSA